MMDRKSFLLVERYCLEALNKGDLDFSGLVKETELEAPLLEQVLEDLRNISLVVERENKFHLNKQRLKALSTADGMQQEVKEILDSSVDQFFSPKSEKQKLKLKKVWLSAEDEKIYKSIMLNLDHFIGTVMEKNKKQKNSRHSRQRLIFWGDSNYGELVRSSLYL